MRVERAGGGAARPAPRRRVAWRRLQAALALLVLIVAACGEPEPPPAADAIFNVIATTSVAAGWLEISHGAGEMVSATSLRPGLIVRFASSAGVTRVAWVGEPQSGSQLQLGFDTGASGWTTPVISGVVAYRNLDEPVAAASFVLQAVSSSASPQAAGQFGPHSLAGLDDQLEAAFADYALGDVDASGQLDVRDALLARRIALGTTTGSAQQRYHSDLDGDYDVDSVDVAMLLEKLTDPTMPARLVVKPRSLSFIRLDASNPEEAVVLIGNGGNQPLTSVSRSDPGESLGVSVTETWTIPQQAAVWRLGEPTDGRWLPNVMSVSGHGGDYSVRLGNLVILVAGQSNASGRGANLTGWPETTQSDPNVRMLGNDYIWTNAREPLDAGQGQLSQGDYVSYDSAPLYSFSTRLGNLLNEAMGFDLYLIPAAKGGSCLLDCGEPNPDGSGDTGAWRLAPGDDHLNRARLLGSANFRAQVAAGRQANPVTGNAYGAESGPVNLVVWYQGESENSSSERANYKSRTLDVFNSFGSNQFGAAGQGRVVLVQLGSHLQVLNSLQQNDIAERQRQLEAENGNVILVVAHDLPRSDHIHLSAAGQRVLAERIALAVRESVFGEDVDGTGPRPLSISRSGNQVRIKVDRPLVVGTLDATMFAVFDGTPSGSIDTPETYGLNAVEISTAEVLAADPTTIVLTLDGPAPATPHVRHMPQPGRPNGPDVWTVLAQGVATGAASGLPLPQFGPRASF